MRTLQRIFAQELQARRLKNGSHRQEVRVRGNPTLFKNTLPSARSASGRILVRGGSSRWIKFPKTEKRQARKKPRSDKDHRDFSLAPPIIKHVVTRHVAQGQVCKASGSPATDQY